MIRLATEADRDELFQFCEDCYYSLPNPAAEFSTDSTHQLITTFLGGVDKVIILSPGVGTLFAFATPVFYNTTVYQAYELLWWVTPEKRKNRDAIRLFKCYEAWAAKIGCETIQTSLVHGWFDLEKFYLRNGYTKTETSYRKRLNGY